MFLYFTDDGVQMLLFCASVSGDGTMKEVGTPLGPCGKLCYHLAFLYLLGSSTSYHQVPLYFRKK